LDHFPALVCASWAEVDGWNKGAFYGCWLDWHKLHILVMSADAVEEAKSFVAATFFVRLTYIV